MSDPIEPRMFGRLAMAVLWPAFLMAGVLEALVFVVVDPAELRWFGGPALGWSTLAVYTVTFLIIWMLMSLTGALTAMMIREIPESKPPAPGTPAAADD